MLSKSKRERESKKRLPEKEGDRKGEREKNREKWPVRTSSAQAAAAPRRGECKRALGLKRD